MSALRLYLDVIVFVFGAVVGSFLNVCVHRMPRDQSLATPRSHCPHCKAPIRWRDNIPLLSFILLRGRCRHCQAPISPRYFIVELLTATLFLLVWLKVDGWTGPIYWLLIAGLIVATFIDFEHYIIPNEITYGGIVAGLLLSALYPPLMEAENFRQSLARSALGVLVGGTALLAVAIVGEKIFKKEAMGMGDVKFLAAIGAFLGWEATLFTLFVSSLLGGTIGLLLVLLGKRAWQSRIPYGPYIALGAVVWIFGGREILDWYIQFLMS
jgi:leader peptidase (prepilin peptidase)/N-methyltransferase